MRLGITNKISKRTCGEILFKSRHRAVCFNHLFCFFDMLEPFFLGLVSCLRKVKQSLSALGIYYNGLAEKVEFWCEFIGFCCHVYKTFGFFFWVSAIEYGFNAVLFINKRFKAEKLLRVFIEPDPFHRIRAFAVKAGNHKAVKTRLFLMHACCHFDCVWVGGKNSWAAAVYVLEPWAAVSEKIFTFRDMFINKTTKTNIVFNEPVRSGFYCKSWVIDNACPDWER